MRRAMVVIAVLVSTGLVAGSAAAAGWTTPRGIQYGGGPVVAPDGTGLAMGNTRLLVLAKDGRTVRMTPFATFGGGGALAANARGEVAMAWASHRIAEGIHTVPTDVRAAVGTFRAPPLVAQFTSPPAEQTAGSDGVAVGIDPRGTATVAWTEQLGTVEHRESRLMVAVLQRGRTAVAQEIRRVPAGGISSTVVEHPDGRATVVWTYTGNLDTGSTQLHILAVTSIAGHSDSFAAPREVAAEPTSPGDLHPVAAYGNAGIAVALVRGYGSGENVIDVVTSDGAGALSAPRTVLKVDACSAAAVTGDASGNLLVAAGLGDGRLRAIRRSPSGAWGAVRELGRAVSGATCDHPTDDLHPLPGSRVPFLAGDRRGRILAVWPTGPGGAVGATGLRWATGRSGVLSSGVRAVPQRPREGTCAQLRVTGGSMAPSGRAMITWEGCGPGRRIAAFHP